jgi:signal transduction histidine kinase
MKIRLSRIGRKLILALVLFSVIITFVTTSTQWYFDYQFGINAIKTDHENIRTEHHDSLSHSIWVMGREQISTELTGIQQLPHISNLSIYDDELKLIEEKTSQRSKDIITIIPLFYTHRGKKLEIGKLVVSSSLDNLQRSFFDKAIIILLSNGLEYFLLMSFFLFIFNYFFVRHLNHFVRFIQQQSEMSRLMPYRPKKKLKNINKPDELDETFKAYNKTTNTLQLTFDRLREKESELLAHQEQLEVLVEKRTEELESRVEELVEARRDMVIIMEDLEIARKNADNANQAKSTFLANMSHEIRTPMNSILGFTELLTDKILDEKQKNYLHSIQSSGRSLLSLINDILDLSKVEAGKIELSLTATNPNSLFKDIEVMFSQKIAHKDLKFMVEIDPQLPVALWIDEIRIKQVLINLIGNALKFTKKGFVKLIVQKIYPDDNYSALDLIFIVEDTGIGIPEDQQQSIFDVFEQQKNQSAAYGGTGLGLSITRRLVEIMGGEITVTSQVDKGSLFQVRLQGVGVASPSTVESVVETNAVNASLEDTDFTTPLKSAVRQRLPELLTELEQKKSEWEVLCKAMPIDGIEKFSNEVRKMGDAFAYPPLQQWGERLNTQVGRFELDKLPKTLDQFPELVEQIRTIILNG